MKFFGVFFVLLVSAVLASPYLVGMKVENSLRAQVAKLDGVELFQASVEEYDRGYRHSQMKVMITLKEEHIDSLLEVFGVEKTPSWFLALSNGVPVVWEVEHGVLLTNGSFGIGWVDMEMVVSRDTNPGWQDLFDMLEREKILSWNIRFGITGTGQSGIIVPELIFKGQGAEESSTVVSGLQMSSILEDFGTYWHSQIELDGITFRKKGDAGLETVMWVRNMVLESIQSMVDPFLIGIVDIDMRVEDMGISSAGEDYIKVNDLRYKFEANYRDSPDTVTVAQSTSIDSAKFLDIYIYDAEDTSTIFDMDKEFMFVLAGVVSPLGELGMDISDAELGIINPVLPKFFRHDPQLITHRRGFQSNKGDLEFEGQVAFKADRFNQPVAWEDMSTFLPGAEYSAECKVSSSLVFSLLNMVAWKNMDEETSLDEARDEIYKKFESYLIPLMDDGSVTYEGGTYSSSFEFSDGSGALNGRAATTELSQKILSALMFY